MLLQILRWKLGDVGALDELFSGLDLLRSGPNAQNRFYDLFMKGDLDGLKQLAAENELLDLQLLMIKFLNQQKISAEEAPIFV